MPETLTVDLASVVKTLESGGLEPDSDALIQVARMIAKLFAVDADEVAILKVVPKFKSLKFILPERLALVGTIPLSSATALAARTARERRAEVVNNFSTARHANVFEAVPLGRDPSELIQKIMSAKERLFKASCKSPAKPRTSRMPAPISHKKICAPSCRFPPSSSVFLNFAMSSENCFFGCSARLQAVTLRWRTCPSAASDRPYKII